MQLFLLTAYSAAVLSFPSCFPLPGHAPILLCFTFQRNSQNGPTLYLSFPLLLPFPLPNATVWKACLATFPLDPNSDSWFAFRKWNWDPIWTSLSARFWDCCGYSSFTSPFAPVLLALHCLGADPLHTHGCSLWGAGPEGNGEIKRENSMATMRYHTGHAAYWRS